MTTGRKLTLGAVVIASVTAYLALAGANSSWQYYLTVDECIDQAPQISGQSAAGARQGRNCDVAH